MAKIGTTGFTDAQQAALFFARKRRRMLTARVQSVAPLTVEEGASNGTSVGVIRLVPRFGKPTFELTDDANGRFEIDPDTGELTVADGSQLVFANDESHDIEVTATDGFRNSFVKTLTVAVTEA